MRASDLHAVHAGQPDVQQHQLEARARSAPPGRLRRFRAASACVAFVLQHAGQRLRGSPARRPRSGCARGLHARLSATAAVSTASAGRYRARGNLDDEARARRLVVLHADLGVVLGQMWLTMARPRPVPRPLVEKYGRNSFSLSSAEMPQPVSATTSSTVSGAAGAAWRRRGP